MIDRHRGLGWMKRGTELFETVAFPLCALAMFGLMLLYARGTNAGYRLDNLLSSRLKLGVEAWQKHGLSAFGTPFSQVGNGFSTMPRANYNFIDSSYPLILIRYGAVMFLAICAIWGNMARQAIRCKDRRLLLALGIIAIHSFAEHHFTEVRFNILLAMPLASFAAAEVEERVAAVDRKTILTHVVTAVLCGLILWLIAPIAVSGLRTVLEYKGLCMAKKTGWTLMGIYLGIIAFVIAAIWAVDRLIRSLLTRRAVAVPAIALALCACVGVGGWLYTNNIVVAAAEANAELIEADRNALEIAASAATGKVYSGILPAAYSGKIDGISCSVFTEDDLARNISDTFLISNKTERPVFLNTGSLYVEISDKHALYSGDRAVIEALTEAGYHATGFYSTVHEVDLTQAAKLNKLSYQEGVGITLSGKKRTMKKGPYFDLYGGRYTVTYELTLPEGEARDDSVVCTLSVTAEKGKKTLLEKEVTGSQFDEDGILTVSTTFHSWNERDAAFCVFTKKEKKVSIRGIYYLQTPDLDIHRFYDSKYRIIREEYYDLDGEQTIQGEGVFACEYSYDGNDNRSEYRYYSYDNKRCNCKNGYAEMHRIYNKQKQIVREDYYDVDGYPFRLAKGYAYMTYDYSVENCIIYRFYDENNQAVLSTDGYSELWRKFDGNHNTIEERYFDVQGQPVSQPAGHYGYSQCFDSSNNLLSRLYIDPHGLEMRRYDGYAGVLWEYDDCGKIESCTFIDENGKVIDDTSLNLAIDTPYEWSSWMTPVPDQINQCYTIGKLMLGDLEIEDTFACQLEIEFKGVNAIDGKQFRFKAQGAVDKAWGKKNIWNTGLVDLNTPPIDGVYSFSAIQMIDENNKEACVFDLGFRCDYWGSGAFRVRYVKIEKGDVFSTPTPGI